MGRRLTIAVRATFAVALVAVVGGSIAAASWALPRYRTASEQVDAWLASDRAHGVGRVLSGPLVLAPGRPGTLDDLAHDLERAGLTRVDQVTAVDQFSVHDDSLRLWVGATPLPSERLPAVRTTVTFSEGRIASVSDGPVRIRPTVLATIGDLELSREPGSLETVSPEMVQAVLAMEDAHFYQHIGIDVEGTLRAARATASGQALQGGSTLTQQLAKNLLVGSERTMDRKIREAFCAIALEQRLDKDALLELYLNELYLGHVAGRPVYGLEMAARGLFGTTPDALTLSQAATLAGIISSPNTYSPVRHPERARERRDLALTRMQQLGFIDEARADAARAEPIEVASALPLAGREVPWVVDGAVDTAHRLGIDHLDGRVLHTFIEPDWQRAAEQAVQEGYDELIARQPSAEGAQLALVAVRVSDGAVVALVGGRTTDASSFDRASSGYRQLGSTVKPLTLLAAMTRDGTLLPTTELMDGPIDRDGWRPRNYDGRYWGRVTVRRAIEASRNIPAIHLAERVGAEGLQDFYKRAGLSRATQWPSASLGAFPGTALELAGAYTAFPNRGLASRPRVLAAVSDADGTVVRANPHESTGIGTARAAALATSVLQGVVDNGTARRARSLGVEGPVAGKTGTTDDWRDAWFVGFTPELVVAVWAGHDRERGIAMTGSRGALPTWARFMRLIGPSTGHFPTNSGLERVPVCSVSHDIARPSCPTTYEELLPRHYGGTGMCPVHDPYASWSEGAGRPAGADDSMDEGLLDLAPAANETLPPQ